MNKDEFKKVIATHENPLVDEGPLIRDLRKIGINVESVWDLVNNKPIPFLTTNFTGDYSFAYPILVKHLDLKHHPKTIEGIIRALTEKPAKEIASAKILDMFYKETNPNLKWVKANALKTLMSWKRRQKHPEIEKTYKGIQ